MGKTSIDIQALNDYILTQIIRKPSESNEVKKVRKQRAQNHFLSLVKNITSTSNGQAFVVTNDDSFKHFLIQIEPNDGLFCGGKFDFSFNLPQKYPKVAPNIKCVSTIFHPNIDESGEICLSLLDDWNEDVNDLLDCVQGLLFLLNNPNLDDILNPNFAPGEYTMEEFCQKVKTLMKKRQ